MYHATVFQGMLIAFSLVSSTSALGINCRGSSNCNTFGNNQVAIELTHAIDGIDPNRWYNNSELVACVGTGAPITGNGAFCAFLQGTGGAPGRNIKGLAHFIPDHGHVPSTPHRQGLLS
ncbi:hypothetical protein FVEN_g8069 [Fusarium venenatum]|uniref:Killer toxin Kp4 domain-containing protein n=1 Tax=Fusarium venenatum TaxID=56646 RepID=A0A2L2TLV0_9HYPO|nr:uncharacterized protein FVRRES_04581 [Fusarium venenatum]KAG8353816.1 hypothetical protein FVEN_g8069 [Fusarium venenatum]KAH6991739.1 killer toxin [Fusarium venenatum]CEI60145.1 unnamed protein product [Fusarium venenatum]